MRLIVGLLVGLSLCFSQVSYADSDNHTVVVGPQGPKGDKGNTGSNGSAGKNGTDGATGARGADGKDGATPDTKAIEEDVHKQGLTAIGIEGAVRLYDSKYIQLQLFDVYNIRGGNNFFFGGRILVKIGKSYEEKLLDAVNKRIDLLMTVAHKPGNHQHTVLEELSHGVNKND